MKKADQRRINRLKKLMGCNTDVEFAAFLKVNQPQVSRWKSVGFHESTAKIIDHLLSIIADQKKEIRMLKKKRRELR